MEAQTGFNLTAAIQNWHQELTAQRGLTLEDRRELESHLRDSISELRQHGVSEEEAFRLACRRLGGPQPLAEEFVKEDQARAWRKRLFGKALAHSNMNTKQIRPRFISGLVAALSATSLALLLMQLATLRVSGQALGSLFQPGGMSLLGLYREFDSGGSFWWADPVRECLLATLILTAAFSLFSLRMSRQTR
jgi:hypothetical protein